MVDPVMQDLNRYLADQEREERRAELEHEKVEEWMKDSSTVQEAWDDLASDGKGLAGTDVVIALTCHADDRQKAALEILELIEKKVRAKLLEGASDAVEADLRGLEDDSDE